MKDFDKAYEPPQTSLWQGRQDGMQAERYFDVIQHVDLRQGCSLGPALYHFGLLGFACDEGVKRNQGRVGAKEGPTEFRQALANLPIHFDHDHIALYDCGNIVCNNEDLEEAQACLAAAVNRLFQLGLKPIVIGGGHEMAWGHYQGLVAAGLGDNKLGIINFDAHLDLRPLLPDDRGSSGTPFNQIAQHCQQQQRNFDYTCIGLQSMANTASLIQRAKQLGVHALLAEEIYLKDPDYSFAFLDDTLDRLDHIYLSICLDVFQENHAPGVSAPQVLGLSPWQVINLLRYIFNSNKIVSLDIAELSPPHDINHKTARLAATLISEYIVPALLR